MGTYIEGDRDFEEIPSLSAKALRINLNKRIYGTFSEIGAGQETVRYFFRAGGASGTIAKAVSAYDKNFSDALYGAEKDGRSSLPMPIRLLRLILLSVTKVMAG